MKLHHLIFSIFLFNICNTAIADTPMISSYEDLATEYDRQGLFSTPQFQVLSVPGLIPVQKIGKFYFYKPKRKPSSLVGITSENKSYEIVQTLSGDCNNSSLEQVQTKIQALDHAAQQLVRLQMQLLSSRTAASLSRSGVSDMAQNEVSLQAAISNAYSVFDSKKAEAMTILNKKNILIYRWAAESKKELGLSLGDLAGLKTSKDEKINGYALVCGVRMRTLVLGTDFKEYIDNVESVHKNEVLLTHSVQAQQIVYGTWGEYAQSLGAYLKVIPNQLQNIQQTLLNLQTIELNMAISSLQNLSNQGNLGGMKVEKINVDFEKNRNSDASYEIEQGWQTFYSTFTDSSDVGDILKEIKSVSKL